MLVPTRPQHLSILAGCRACREWQPRASIALRRAAQNPKVIALCASVVRRISADHREL